MKYNLYIENGESIPAIKIIVIGDLEPSGYTISNNVSVDWDKHSRHIINSDILTVTQIREEILSDYNSIGWGSGNSEQKEIWCKWFVASESERNTIQSSNTQESNADMLSELFLKEKNKIDKSIIIESVMSSTADPFAFTYNQVESSLSETSTVSKDYGTKLNLTTTNIPDGNYKVSWYYETTTSDKGEIETEILYNNEKEIFNGKSKEDEEKFTGYLYVDILEGTHTFDINYKAKKGTVSIKMVTIEITKIN